MVPRQTPQHEPGNRPGVGSDGGEDRFLGPVWVVGNLVELVGDPNQGGGDIGADGELQEDPADAVQALAGHSPNALDALELFLLLEDDLPLDLLRAGPGPDRLNTDLRPIDARNQLHRDPVQGEKAEQDQENHPDDDGYRSANGYIDQGHGVFSPASDFCSRPISSRIWTG